MILFLLVVFTDLVLATKKYHLWSSDKTNVCAKMIVPGRLACDIITIYRLFFLHLFVFVSVLFSHFFFYISHIRPKANLKS